jgi:parallel beta-helix repeat protein
MLFPSLHSLQARVIKVPADSSTIQGGIYGATAGDTVMVYPGTYHEYAIDFLGKSITVMGRDPGDSLVVASTVVNGSWLGSVFLFRGGEDSSTVLTGLKITRGLAGNGGGINCQNASPIITHCIIDSNWATAGGGGIYCRNSSPTILYNLVIRNTSEIDGGGIYCFTTDGTILGNTIADNYSENIGGGIACFWSDPLIEKNTIEDNYVEDYGGGIACSSASPSITNNFIRGNQTGIYNGGGGGIYMYSSSPSVTGNIITSNWSGVWGGGIYCFFSSSPLINGNIITENSANYVGGGGIHCNESSPMISNNTLTGNSADDASGGGISCYLAAPTITNNSIVGNTTDNWGGGIFCWDTDTLIVITNNVIKKNSAVKVGGGISCYSADAPNITNNTISGNTAGDGGGGVSCNSSTMKIINSILWDNHAEDGPEIYIYENPSILTVRYSDVQRGQDSVYVGSGCTLNWGAGIINEDPIFLDGERHLRNTSPCVDAGQPTIDDTCMPPGLREDRSDMGAYGGVDNCWSPVLGINLIFYLPNPMDIEHGGNLTFGSFVLNNTQNDTEGDYWTSVQLPDFSEFVIPAGLSNYLNPLTGEVSAYTSVFLLQRLSIPAQADTGSYAIIARIGVFPYTILDEEEFGFRVID